MPDRPAVRTVPNVEIMQVGTWPASTGPVTWTVEDLLAARAAFDDSGYTRPVLKIGHVDPRFDGQPALGRLANPVLSDDNTTLSVDLVGVPTWLADLIDSTAAFPSRSVEGQFGMTTPTGTKHAFALTALSLLGVTAPAVSTLADVAMLYGLDPVEVAASTPTVKEDEPMPQHGNVEVTASISVDSVRQAFYGSAAQQSLGAWAWIMDVQVSADGSNFVVVDDDEGSQWKVPWSEGEGKTVAFDVDAKERVTIEYVPTPLPEATAASKGNARAFAAAHQGAPAAPTQTPAAPEPSGQNRKEGDLVPFALNDEQAIALRKRLGLAEDASDDDVAAALAAPPEGTEDHPQHQQIAAGAGRIPAGAVVLDAEQFAELQTQASNGNEALRRLRASDRDTVLDGAVKAGKFARSRIEHWQKLWDADPEGTRATVETLAANVVPVSLSGHVGVDADEEDIDREFASIDPPKEA